MVQPWADQPFSLIPTSKVTKPAVSKDAIYVADSMASAHNMFIRILNSIYLQAPYVKEEGDIQDLLQYSLFWEDFIRHHHNGEETVFFPEVEKVTGEKGIMDRNIEQHHAFESGMETWVQYTSECMKRDGMENFDATQFRKLINGFAPQLVEHLSEEILTLLALDKYEISGVVQAWDKFDKHMQEGADTV